MKKLFINTKRTFSFKHWSRKAYAIFASLKLQIRIACLSVAMLLGSFSQVVVAQVEFPRDTNSVGEYDLDTLEVIGQLSPELAQVVSRSISKIVIPAQHHLPLSSINSTLQVFPQLDIRQRGPHDIQADISLRASTFDQVQILLNGFDISDPQTGHHSLNLPISFSQLYEIQLLSGPASRALGANAYAGAINFITKKPRNNSMDLLTEVGDFGFTTLALGYSVANAHGGNYFSLNRSSSSGYAKNTDFYKYSIFYFGDFNKIKSNWQWQIAYANKAFGANDFYTPKFPNQYEHLQTAMAGLRFNTKGKIFTSTSVHYRFNADRFELFRHGMSSPSWYHHPNFHWNNSFQLNTKMWLWSAYGKTTIALNYRLESVFSNVLGVATLDTIFPFYDKEAYYNKKASRDYTNASIEQVYHWKKFTVAAGLMYYYSLQTNDFKGIYPGIDLGFVWTKNTKLFAAINTGMRLPTFTDLYYSGPSNIGNDNLLPESQLSYELGVKSKNNYLMISASVFLNKARNSIDWVRKSNNVKWQPINVSTVNSKGVDLALTFYPKKTDIVCFSWIKKMSFAWAYVQKQTSSPQYQSHYVMDYLKNKVILELSHELYKHFYLGYTYSYYQREGQFLWYDSRSKLSQAKGYKPFGLFNIRLSWDYNTWNIYSNVSNLFDVKYQDYGNVVQAGRWFTVGVKKNFLFKKNK